ncbi:putative nonsense-mediated mrna decay protein [Diaporthe ampelina]|uniref:Putative nonsense-mediated mrna decay protein n=1 Tax=Diaporthe ampelina TaxID=1214573 RepID=A0A0G2FE31_9PEZI|nr:putative nonsense-mediated mrna decay protein [Diaporthe ampelina]
MATPEGKSGPKQAGVLPIRPAQTQGPPDSSRSAKSKAAAQDGIKAKVRRLPPGLNEQEFLTILGDSWKPGNGKVGWFSYHCGHTPKTASKDSTPAFALLQVKEEDLEYLDHAVQNATWEDAKGTFNSPSLVGLPYVERSIYKKMPLAKPKKDPKEGTIDQDEDYKAFLASLAEDSTMKPDEAQADAEDPTKAEADAKITIAPLAQFIKENREKKANKAKEAAAARSSKHSRQESQGAKGKGSSAPDDSRKKSKEKATEKPKETVRILKKQAATEAAAEAAKAVAKDIKSGNSSSDAASSRRAGIQGVANILKRDLGLSNGSAARKARQEVAKQEAAKKGDAEPKPKEPKGKDSGSKNSASLEPAQAADRPPTPTAPKAQAEKSSRPGRSRRGKESKSADSKTGGPAEAPAAAPKAPVILQKKKEDSAGASAAKESPNTAKSASKQGSSSAAPTPPTGPKAGAAKGSQSGGSQKKNSNPALAAASTRAFLKHANPSQGVTEALLKEAMQAFGGISFVEIDRRKGFAYVDFSDHAGLVKAMAASPVSVAQATVQVLERKDQGSKKAASTPSNQAQSGAASSGSNTAAAGPADPPTAPSPNADKSGNGTPAADAGGSGAG